MKTLTLATKRAQRTDLGFTGASMGRKLYKAHVVLLWHGCFIKVVSHIEHGIGDYLACQHSVGQIIHSGPREL